MTNRVENPEYLRAVIAEASGGVGVKAVPFVDFLNGCGDATVVVGSLNEEELSLVSQQGATHVLPHTNPVVLKARIIKAVSGNGSSGGSEVETWE